MPATEQIQVKKLTPNIGAEITGVDLSKPLQGETVKAIKDALWENQVIFFRDQPLTMEQHVQLGRSFGTLYIHPAAKASNSQEKANVEGVSKTKAYASAVEGFPEIVCIYADENSAQVAGEEWHSDVTSESSPPLGSILRIEELPPVGGDTLFASMYAAYEALSEPMKRFLEPLTAIHDGMKVYGTRGAFDHTRQYPRSEHPVIRTHPESGRQGLFVSTTFTTRIVQLSKGESDAVLRYLFDHLQQPLFQCRFRWERNSIAFWDNRCTQHQAQWDYHPHRRIGYRVQLIGELPFNRNHKREEA